MKKIEFAVDSPKEKPSYGIIAIIENGIQPVGPQNFSSEERAITAFLRAVGDAMKPPA